MKKQIKICLMALCAIAVPAAAEEIDMNWESSGEFVDILTGLGLTYSTVASGATIVIRTNQNHEPYQDVRVRKAIAMAVDNATDFAV